MAFYAGSPSFRQVLARNGDVRIEGLGLAASWCAVSGYLSFFAMDCLMMRWLIHYTPIASIVRLITASVINYIFTNFVLERSGSSKNLNNLFPAWTVIAVVLGILYGILRHGTNIRRENDLSPVVFGMASFVSMCILIVLQQLHVCKA
ncbi:hypothetical protein EJ06DRAFT_556637 [Trichodelitschia bisporula]|uniref:Uncharacterized protein n=1 Tax=Trichodelitschia bisporula TaxID=703511 RepID=A0A6G1HX40_9PEZI|nr:hypothetical protein EJ06DRAFT_556637 [Trichodelitschia bisporula]